ncbi:MAG: LPXTG cell wall anchor domain-containing protein [Clostridia bacterium]|nr:LPXTG cell wall anchor domain-containing protein [Clostridia bacterium]
MKKVLTVVMALVLAFSLLTVASADMFVPSIADKDNAEVVVQTDENGNPVSAIIYDQEGNVIGTIDQEGGVIVTTYSDKDNADTEINSDLTDAFDNLSRFENLGDVVADLEKFLEDGGVDITPEELAVSQLIDVRAEDYTIPDGGTAKIVVKYNEPFVTMIVRDEDGSWHVFTDYTVNGDGTVTLNVKNFTQFAFVKTVYGTNVNPADPGTASPQTGDWQVVVFSTLGVLFAAAAVLFFVKAAKKQKA